MDADDSRSELWPEGKPMSCNWISDELLLETQEHWSEAYGRPIDRDEAVEILMNVKRLGEVLSNIPPKLRDDFTTPQPAEEDLPQDALSILYRFMLRKGYVKIPEEMREEIRARMSRQASASDSMPQNSEEQR